MLQTVVAEIFLNCHAYKSIKKFRYVPKKISLKSTTNNFNGKKCKNSTVFHPQIKKFDMRSFYGNENDQEKKIEQMSFFNKFRCCCISNVNVDYGATRIQLTG